MPDRKYEKIKLPKEFRIVGLATILLGALPFVVYGVESWIGLLVTEETWLAQGFNHGPWRWEAEGFTVAYPLLLLALVTITISAVHFFRLRQFRVIGAGLGLLILQLLLIVPQFFFLFWLID